MCVWEGEVYISIFATLDVLNIIQPERQDMMLYGFQFGGSNPLEVTSCLHAVVDGAMLPKLFISEVLHLSWWLNDRCLE